MKDLQVLAVVAVGAMAVGAMMATVAMNTKQEKAPIEPRKDSSFETELTRRPDSELESFKLAATRSGTVSFDDLLNENSTPSLEEVEATATSTPEYKRVEQAKMNMDRTNKEVWDNPTEENETAYYNAMKEWNKSTSAYYNKMKEIGIDYFDPSLPSGKVALSNGDWHGLEEVRDRVKEFAEATN